VQLEKKKFTDTLPHPHSTAVQQLAIVVVAAGIRHFTGSWLDCSK